mgnify:CR=1 FL=1
MIKKTSQQTVRSLLSKNNDEQKEYRYTIPPYQREYSWQREQWDNLFDDILDNDKGYFLGSMICIAPDNAAQTFQAAEVIDGQQRLTTLNLLLLAIYAKLKAVLDANETAKVLLHDNREHSLAWLEFQDYFLHGDDVRLTLSIQNSNNTDYTYLVNSTVRKVASKPEYFGNRRIAKAFNHFTARLNALLDEQELPAKLVKIFDLLGKITTATVVRIDTADAASAFILFESINNRGLPLTPMDLIKNSIIGSLKTNPAQTNQIWQTIINNLNDYETQVRYLRHFYQAYKPAGHIFAKEKGKDKITKNDLIKVYTEAIKQQPENVLASLTQKSDVYQIFALPENIRSDSLFAKYQSKLIDLQKLGTAPSHTLLLFLFERYPEQNFTSLLGYLEQWFIIRHLTNIPATNKLDDLFIEATRTQHTGYDENQIIRTLTQELPSQERIKEALDSKSLYEDNPGLVRSLLIYLEQLQRTAENKTDFWAVSSKGKTIWSIEHIYPQNPKAGEWADDCKSWLHALGNLTLTAYNSNLSNKSFDKKASVLEDGKDIGLKSGNVKINQYLCDKSEWTAVHIETRGKELITQFIESLKFK